MEQRWYSQTISSIYKAFNSQESGLTDEVVQEKLKSNGANSLPDAKFKSLFQIFIEQFQSPLIYILFISAIIILFLGESADAYIIIFILIFNSLLGTIQEGKAQDTLKSLRKLNNISTTVLRSNLRIIVNSKDIVAGDIVLIQEGEQIPADIRLIESNNLEIDESALTGESQGVHKTIKILEDTNLLIQDQTNIVFKGTHVLSGSAKGIVIATGFQTKIGQISKEILNIETEIPLKRKLKNLSNLLLIIILITLSTLFIIGLLSGKDIKEMFISLVSLSVSIIPEGLPIVITLILTTGVWRMSKRNVLVKKLQAIESLGQANILAVDKTGTITKNEMFVKQVFINNNLYKISGNGYESKGEVYLNSNKVSKDESPEFKLVSTVALNCSNSNIQYDNINKTWNITGDPTEAALKVLGEKFELNKDDFPRIKEIPFNYKNKYHISLNTVDNESMLSMVGSPEVILNLASNILINNVEEPIKDHIDNLKVKLEEFYKTGNRVLGFGICKNAKDSNDLLHENPITFLGFYIIQDTLRENLKESVNKIKKAGIKVVMITGDNEITAKEIATQAGIYQDGDGILSGYQLDSFTDEELKKEIINTTVFARVSPEHKLRIINAYKANNLTIAMTGDGVNDAPSLVSADLGISMGKIGTEVAKEASDLVLLDDNFSTITAAIEEGRNIYINIKKVILYLFSTNLGELLTIAVALLIGLPLPLLATQIIWLNLVTDSFLDVSISMEKKEDNILRSKFTLSSKYIVDLSMLKRMILMALPMMLGTLYVFILYYQIDFTKATTLAMTLLAVFQWFNAWNCRSETKSIFRQNPFSNKYLIGATIIVVGLQFLALYNPFMQNILHTTSISFEEWIMILIIASSVIVVEEIRKLIIYYNKYKEA